MSRQIKPVVEVHLDPATIRYLDVMVETGIYGQDRDEVMRFLIMDGIRNRECMLSQAERREEMRKFND